MVSLWLQAMVERPFVLCGKRLLPFSLAHIFYLRRLGNPYVCGGVRTWDDLCSAILICSMTQQKIARLLGGRAYCLWPRVKMFFWSRAWYPRREKIAAAFEQYVEDHSRVSDRWEEEDQKDNTDCKCPWELHMVRMLCTNFRMTPPEAWNTSFSRARCYCDTVMELNGNGKSIVSEYEEQLMEAAQ